MLDPSKQKKPLVWNPHLGEDDFASAEAVSDATDKIRVLEARVRSLSNHAAASKRHAEMSDKHIQIEQGMHELEVLWAPPHIHIHIHAHTHTHTDPPAH